METFNILEVAFMFDVYTDKTLTRRHKADKGMYVEVKTHTHTHTRTHTHTGGCAPTHRPTHTPTLIYI